MGKLESHKSPVIRLTVHPPMEFLYAMYDAAKEEELMKVYEEFNSIPDERVQGMIKGMRKRLSRYLLRELDYFFEMTEAIGHIFPNFILHHPEIVTVQGLIQSIEKEQEEKILFYLLKSVVHHNAIEPSKGLQWETLQHDLSQMVALVQTVPFKNPEIKEKLVECLENPSETKQRYILMLKGFYEKAYEPIEAALLEELAIFKEQYKAAFDENPQEFFREYFKMNLSSYESNVYIHISMFKYSGWFKYGEEEEEVDPWIVLGIHSDRFFGKKAARERVERFFRVLSDKRRLVMMELLAERPWYGNELAEKLELTPATVSYHLGFFIELDLVTFERQESRLYYSLSKEKVKDLFEDAKRVLLHEQPSL